MARLPLIFSRSTILTPTVWPRLVTAALMVLGAPEHTAAEPFRADDRAGALASRLLGDSGAPGAAVGLIENGQRGLAAAGIRARGTTVGVTRQDQWHIGSNAKSMTATLVARLVEAGFVGWNDTVGRHLCDLDPHPELAAVTFEMLLAHRGGVRADIGLQLRRELSGMRADVVSDRRRYAAEVLGKAPENRPGTAFHYSNAGYVVVGAMLEAATGQTWEELIEDWVFVPLTLESAGFGPPGTAETLNQPRGHGGFFPWSRGARVPGQDADNIAAMGPAGRVHLSVADHLRYLRAHLSRPQSFLSAQSWDRLHGDVAGQGYALGWVVRDDGILLHAGSNTFWFNLVLIDPAHSAALVLALNTGAGGRIEEATEEIAGDFLAGLDDP